MYVCKYVLRLKYVLIFWDNLCMNEWMRMNEWHTVALIALAFILNKILQKIVMKKLRRSLAWILLSLHHQFLQKMKSRMATRSFFRQTPCIHVLALAVAMCIRYQDNSPSFRIESSAPSFLYRWWCRRAYRCSERHCSRLRRSHPHWDRPHFLFSSQCTWYLSPSVIMMIFILLLSLKSCGYKIGHFI